MNKFKHKFKPKDLVGIKAARYAKRMECGTTRKLKEGHSKSLMLFNVTHYFSIYGNNIHICRVDLKIAALSTKELKHDVYGYMYIVRNAAYKCIGNWLEAHGAVEESYATYAISCCLYDNDSIRDWTIVTRTIVVDKPCVKGVQGVREIAAEPTAYRPFEVLNLGYSLRHKRAMRAGISISAIKPIRNYFMQELDKKDSKHENS